MRELGSGTTYNTHNTTSLIRTLKYVPDILQTEEAFTVKGYKHTHTHTHTETSQLICRPNQLAGFYMMATLAFNELKLLLISKSKLKQ